MWSAWKGRNIVEPSKFSPNGTTAEPGSCPARNATNKVRPGPSSAPGKAIASLSCATENCTLEPWLANAADIKPSNKLAQRKRRAIGFRSPSRHRTFGWDGGENHALVLRDFIELRIAPVRRLVHHLRDERSHEQ